MLQWHPSGSGTTTPKAGDYDESVAILQHWANPDSVSYLHDLSAEFGLEQDDETVKLIEFVSLASGFASRSRAERLRALPRMVTKCAELLNVMRQDVKELADASARLDDLASELVRMLKMAKNIAAEGAHVMEQAITQFTILQEIEDTAEIRLALDALDEAMSYIVKIAADEKKESDRWRNNLAAIKGQFVEQKSKATMRSEFVSHAGFVMPALAAIGGGGLLVSGASAAIEAVAFGGIGQLVVAGVACPPATVLMGAAALGGAVAGAIVWLMSHWYKSKNEKMVQCLTRLLSHILEMEQVNTSFYDAWSTVETPAKIMQRDSSTIRRCLQSALQKKHNPHILEKAKANCEDIRAALLAVKSIDWEDKLLGLTD